MPFEINARNFCQNAKFNPSKRFEKKFTTTEIVRYQVDYFTENKFYVN